MDVMEKDPAAGASHCLKSVGVLTCSAHWEGEQLSTCIRTSLERFFHKLVAVAASASIAVVLGAGVAAATPVYWSTAPSWATTTYEGGRVAGNIFTAITPQTYNSLGFIDLNPSCLLCGADGLLGSYQVGIWLVSTQQLLASAWVTPSSPLGTPADGGEQFRWTVIPTVTIPAGQDFLVAALLPATPLDPWLNSDAHVNGAGIVGPGFSRFEIATTLTYPTQVGLTGNYSIANANTIAIVPEPATASLILLSLGGLAAFRRYHRSGP